MELGPNIDPHELLRYAQDEIAKKAARERAERQAVRDKILAKIEADRQATAKADAERDRLADPAFRAAEMIEKAVGDEWPALVALIKSSSMTRLAAAMTRLDAQREATARHADVTSASPTREAERVAVEIARKTKIERQLADAGVLADVTAD